ncbi:MAG: DUF2207 domain-containing protein, partial [Clostridium sp.]
MNKLLSFIVLFLLLFNFTPAFAESRSYEINKVDINAVIMDNGDINVTEYLTYNFSGDFNGFLRALNSNGSDGCVVNSITIIDKLGVETEAKVSSTGAENTYEISHNGYNTAIKLYSKSSNEKKTFKVNYTAKNAAKKYSDVGELYWNFYSVENIQSINEANLNITFNNEELTEKNSRYETFGDGKLSTTYINNGININYKNLTSMIGINLTIPSEFLTNSPTILNNNNQNSNNNDVVFEGGVERSNSGSAITISFVIVVITLIVVVAIRENRKQSEAVEKYRSEYGFVSNIKYIEPPSNISPALVNLLMYDKNISREILSSTLFYLCNLGYYNVEEVEYSEKGFFGDKVKKDLRFKRNINKISPRENHLAFIIELFLAYETNNEFSLLEIQSLLKNRSEGRDFIDKLNEWKVEVIEDAKLQGYFTTIRNKEVLTNEFYNEKLKWLSYKEFVESSINIKERLNEVNTADTILIYAKALGINNVAIENYINKLISSAKRDNNLDMNQLNNMNNAYYFNYYLIYMDNMNSIYHTVTPDSSSNNDSGGGFDGGSSGGDFG